MKVIQVIPNLCMGGAEIMCETLTLELIKNGIDVLVVSLYNYKTPITERLIQSGVRIEFLDKKRGVDLSIIKKLKKLFKREKPDVIHSHLNAQKYAVLAAKKANIPTIVHTVHNVADKELTFIDKLLARRFYKKYKVVPVALSKLIQDTISNEYKIPNCNIPIISNGIDLSKCSPKTDYAIINRAFKILHIGRFMEQKNHIGLIKAFSIFHQKYPKSRLQLIGDGEKRSEIEDMVKKMELSNSVDFIGLQDNVYTYLHDADIFTLTSFYEGIPMTLIEAMGTGLPIVATSVGGVPDMLANNENAILTATDDCEIANALIKLSNNTYLRQKIGKNALLRSEDFSAEAMTTKYVNIYSTEHYNPKPS